MRQSFLQRLITVLQRPRRAPHPPPLTRVFDQLVMNPRL